MSPRPKKPAQHTPSIVLPGWAAGVILAISVCAVYCPALNVPLIFDDQVSIVENESITSVWPLVGTRGRPGPLGQQRETPTSGRPLVNLSFAINYYFGGVNPIGYHAVNIAIHILAAFLLWELLRRTLELPYFAGRFNSSARWLALAAAMLWALHPLVTETVIYATQRSELMVAFFYLATLYCSMRYWNCDPQALGASSAEHKPDSRRRVWLLTAILACLAGMASKEVMVSAPLIVLLFERTFVAGSLAKALRRSWPLYVGLASTWVLLLVLALNNPHKKSAGFGLNVPLFDWWLVQSKVLLVYFKLAVWPRPLSFHYQYPYFTTFAAAFWYVVPVILLGITALVMLWRNTPAGFVGAWVFAILAPTSIVPIPLEMAAERRMYLPLAAIVALVVVGVYGMIQSRPARSSSPQRGLFGLTTPQVALITSGALVALAIGVVSARRLTDYRDPIGIWQQVVRRQPENYVAYNSLGRLLFDANRESEAIEKLQAAILLNPRYDDALNNLGVVLAKSGRFDESLQLLHRAVQLSPESIDSRVNLGNALIEAGQFQQAIDELRAALALNADDPYVLYHMGLAFTQMGKFPEAIDHFERALSVKPNYAEARINLAVALCGSGKNPQAIEQLRMAIQVDPTRINARYNLAVLLAESGNTSEAITQLVEVLRLQPDFSDAHDTLGDVLRQANRTKESIEHYQAALRLNPNQIEIHRKLAQTLALAHRPEEAIATAQKAIEIARLTHQTAAAQSIEEWLAQYRTELGRSKAATPDPRP